MSGRNVSSGSVDRGRDERPERGAGVLLGGRPDDVGKLLRRILLLNSHADLSIRRICARFRTVPHREESEAGGDGGEAATGLQDRRSPAAGCFSVDCFSVDCFSVDCFSVDCFSVDGGQLAHQVAVGPLQLGKLIGVQLKRGEPAGRFAHQDEDARLEQVGGQLLPARRPRWRSARVERRKEGRPGGAFAPRRAPASARR